MRETTVARSYAEALFDLAEQKKLHDDFLATISVLESAFQSEPQLAMFLASPKVGAQAKKNALHKALEDRAHPLFLNFLMLLVDKRRQRLLLEVGREYRNRVDEHQGRLHVQVTVARQPEEKMRADLTQQLGRSLGREVVPHFQVNRDILGGIIVRFGDRVLDGSLRRRMLSLRRRMLDAGLPSNP
ncbi:MAG: ATP synthase F1 subunit delta [Longimicrobiales bacterium]